MTAAHVGGSGESIVADFVAGVTWEQLPLAVQRKARMALLDTLGATLAGTLTPVSRIAADCATRIWPGDEATVLLACRRASAWVHLNLAKV